MKKLSILAAAAVLSPAGLSALEPARFEAASITPSRSASFGYSGNVEATPGQPVKLHFHNVSLAFCIQQAYSVNAYQVSGPGWIKTARYDVEATLASGAGPDQAWPALQTLLAESMQLSVQREKKELKIYTLTAAKDGPKLRTAAGRGPQALQFLPDARERLGGNGNRSGTVRQENATIAELCAGLSLKMDRPVLDMSGIPGRFDFELSYGGSEPSIPGALQKQLGLKLERGKGDVEMLIVEKASRKPAASQEAHLR